MAFSKIGGKGIDLSTDIITEFNSTGVDDNATATTITLNANNTATIPNVTGNTTFNEYITVTNLTVNNDASISNDLTVGGNFIITGNTFTVDSTSLKVEDSLIHLAGNNVSNDIIDIGFIGHYSNDSGNTELFTGFYRDATDEQYYLFNGLSDDINTATTIDKTGTGYTAATLNVGEFYSSYNSGNGLAVYGGVVKVNRPTGFPNIFWTDGTDNLGAIYFDKTNGMRIFSTDGSTGNPERIRIDTDGHLNIQSNVDISPSAGANGQFHIDGNAYSGAIALDGTAMYVYHNSASRNLVLATNETAQLTLLASGDVQVNRGKIYVHDSAGSTSNSLKLSYNATNGGAVIGPDSNGGSTYLSIGTSNSGTFAERMYISSAGNVGISDGNPQEKLSVVGGILAASSSGSTSGITIESTATAGYVSTITHTDTGMEFDTGSILRHFKFDGAGTNLWTLYTNTGNIDQNYGVYRFAATTSGSDTGSQFQLWGTNGGPGYMAAYQLNFNTGGNNSRTTSMHINNNGHVGIGTNSPYDSAWGVSSKQLAISGDTYGVLHLLGNYNSITTRYSIGAGGGDLYLAYDDVNGQHRIMVDSTGRVGINTTNPAHILSINTNSGKSIEFNWWTSGSSNYIQSYDRTNGVYLPLTNFATDVIFHNGSSEIGRINSTGLAIGTGAAPDARLNINTPNYTSSATAGMIKWDNPDVSASSSIQGYYVSGAGSEIFIGTNSYITTTGATARYNSGYASSAIYPRRDGSVNFYGAGSGSSPTLRYVIEGVDGSHKYYNNGVSGTPVKRDYFYHFVTFSSGGYVHMKTNISWASHTQMYSIHFEGHEYQASKAIDTTLAWYSYSPNNAAINVGSSGTHTASVYSSSDGYLVMVWYASSTTYYSGFTLSQRTTAQGINTGFAVTNTITNNSSTGAF